MKVIFLSRLFHPHIGGVEKHVEKISLALIEKGIQVAIITTQYESSLSTKDEYKGITIWRMPRTQILSKTSIWKWMYKHKQDLNSADVIHAHDVHWWLSPLIPLLQTPIYTTFHGWEGSFPPKLKAKLTRKFAEKTSRANICVGDFIPKWYGTKPNLVTYGATDQKPLPSGSKDKLLVLGRLSRDNDIAHVIKGLRIIKQRLPKMKITFLGDGELSWEAEKIGAVLGFQDNIEKYLEPAHWVIASSYLSILDALASGRDVFSFYSNPLKKDYLDLHPMAKKMSIAFSPEMFADQLTDHYFNPSYFSHTVQEAQQWALQQTWQKLTESYLDLWSNDYCVAAENFTTFIQNANR